MAPKNTKLELTWIGKENRPQLEPRILLHDPEKSYHAKHRVSKDDLFDNKLIFGDNLLALKALEQEYSGKVKCIFIDPPYNTGSAFTHYEDGLEHSIWLGMMRDRLEILRTLLSEDGSIWITIDDNEAHYLKVLCDEVFGRKSFVASFIWRKVDSPNDNKVPIAPDHEYIFCYEKVFSNAGFKQKQDPGILEAYRPADEISDRPYRDRLLKKNGKNSLRSDRPTMYYPIIAPDGNEIYPMHDDGREACWAMSKKSVEDLESKGELVWKMREGSMAKRWIPYTREYAPANPTRPYPTIWNDLDTTRQTKAHLKLIFGLDIVFDTPKPENLIERILNISTNPSDLVLDSFGGSGTTGAVAHKMGRKWIMVELGEHCHTHIIPRLQKVIDGTDQGGISKAVNWKGGGGFQYYRLAPSLMDKDAWGNWVISPQYNAAMLAEALCKLEGFRYAPSTEVFWKHGRSTEQDFLYATTAHLQEGELTQLNDEVGSDRSLLVLCTAFEGDETRWPSLTIKKIPSHVLGRCEFGHDDYCLEVANLQPAPVAEGTQMDNV
jgi:adenine-specific DNA-methyltransferase